MNDQPKFETRRYVPVAKAGEGEVVPFGPRDDAPPIGERIEAEAAAELEIFDVGDEDGKIEPREWLLGTTYCRRNLSGLISAGAAGKTTVRIAQLLSAACDRRLTGEHVFVQCRAMIVCLEDDMKELRRRVRAAMLHHNVKPEDVKGRLFLTTPRGLKIAERDEKGRVAAGGLYRALSAAIDKLTLDIVAIDPAVKAHELDENSNPEIDAFATLLTGLAVEKNIAIDLLSHERKAAAAAAGDVNRGRGAGSMKDAARLVYTLTGMSEAEAGTLGVKEVERKSLVRVDSAKVNIAPPSATTTWFRIVGVNLGNGNDAYPAGDNVQTVERWEPAPLFDGINEQDLNSVLRKLGSGMGNGRRYSLAPGATDRAAWRAVQEKFPDMGEERCRAVIAAWKKNKLFETGEYEDPVRRTTATGILSAKLIGEGQ